MEAALDLEQPATRQAVRARRTPTPAPRYDLAERARVVAWCQQNGYMTGEEFERRVIAGLEKRLKANGYL
ncbi:MAG: hypothetical protein LBS63_04905 [Prevotellaceae bacterium]|jgi:hypothetical protein|nr:hypothetical protein [Prevotellaceae bacterium]